MTVPSSLVVIVPSPSISNWEMVSMITTADDVFAKFFDVFSLDVSFLRSHARSKFFEKTACVAAINFVRKSWKSEPSSRFFGRLKFCPVSNFWDKFDFWMRFLLFLGRFDTQHDQHDYHADHVDPAEHLPVCHHV